MVSAGARELEVMSLAVNYHRWTYDVIKRYIGRRVLEVGGGIGSLSQSLLDRDRLVILDYDQFCAARLGEQFGAYPHVRVVHADITDASSVSALSGEHIDTVFCMNVLEHIENDRLALHHMFEVLSPGGDLILLVPAHPSLYGTLDDLVGHFRRYDRPGLIEKVSEVGFECRRCFYFNSVGAAGRYFIGRVRRQKETGAGQVRFYDRYVVPVLSRVERVITPPFGQSLIVVARKPTG